MKEDGSLSIAAPFHFLSLFLKIQILDLH